MLNFVYTCGAFEQGMPSNLLKVSCSSWNTHLDGTCNCMIVHLELHWSMLLQSTTVAPYGSSRKLESYSAIGLDVAHQKLLIWGCEGKQSGVHNLDASYNIK